MKMKRIILTLTMLVALVATASAQAEIKFDKLIHNFGSFEESNPVQIIITLLKLLHHTKSLVQTGR